MLETGGHHAREAEFYHTQLHRFQKRGSGIRTVKYKSGRRNHLVEGAIEPLEGSCSEGFDLSVYQRSVAGRTTTKNPNP